jgi:hypothetical protein
MSTHSASETFAGLRARCVVCGAAIIIPKTAGEVAGGWEGGAAEGSRSRSSAGGRRSSPRPVTLEPDEEDPISYEELLSDDYLDEEAETPAEEDETEDADAEVPKGEKEPRPASVKASDEEAIAARKKKQLYLYGGIGGGVLLLVILYLAFGGSSDNTDTVAKKGDNVEKAPPLGPPPAAQPAPPPPPPKKDEGPKQELAPPPRQVFHWIRGTLAEFLQKRNEDPAGFDQKLAGKPLEIITTHKSNQNGIMLIGEAPEDNGVRCFLPGLGRKPKKDAKGKEVPPAAEGEYPQLAMGQPVTLRGEYSAPLKLLDTLVVRTSAIADEKYKDKTFELLGAVVQQVFLDGEGDEKFPFLTLEPPSTDCPISIRCVFRPSERDNLATIQSGQSLTIRGLCSGRLGKIVRLHECRIIKPTDLTDPDVMKFPANVVFSAYESDLLPAPRPDPSIAPIPLTAERLGAVFTSDLELARERYVFRMLEVSGRLIKKDAAARKVILEGRTNDRYQIEVVFSPANFEFIRNDKEITVRGYCVGVRDRFIRLEGGELIDHEPRTVPEFLPFHLGRELVYERLVVTSPKSNEYEILSVRVAEPDQIRTTLIRVGRFQGGTLFGERTPPRWDKKPKSGYPPLVAQHRLRNDTVEIRAIPAPPRQPGAWWDPVLKLGFKKGESWSAEYSEDGATHTVTYTVLDIGKDERGRQLLELRRVEKNSRDPNNWYEDTITYARGIGEIKRIGTIQGKDRPGLIRYEQQLLEDGVPKFDEPKTPGPAPKKDKE